MGTFACHLGAYRMGRTGYASSLPSMRANVLGHRTSVFVDLVAESIEVTDFDVCGSVVPWPTLSANHALAKMMGVSNLRLVRAVRLRRPSAQLVH